MTEYTKADKVTQAEIVVALENHGVFNTASRIRKHGIAVDYVPMTDDELLTIFDERETFPDYVLARNIEQAVLNRLGVAPTLEPTIDQPIPLDEAKAICEANGLAVVPRTAVSKLYKALAAIVTTRQTDKQMDDGVIPREPVMKQIVRIRMAMDEAPPYWARPDAIKEVK